MIVTRRKFGENKLPIIVNKHKEIEMNTYFDIAKEEGLNGKTAERYIQYMLKRWADNEETNCLCGYASEWAQRFASGYEYDRSDSYGQQILKEIDATLSRSK